MYDISYNLLDLACQYGDDLMKFIESNIIQSPLGDYKFTQIPNGLMKVNHNFMMIHYSDDYTIKKRVCQNS